MRILVSNCESAKHGAICRTYVQTTRHAFVGKCPWLCLHNMHADYRILCDDCHDDELRRSEECVSRCAARAGAEPQRQRKPGNTWKTDAFPSPKATKRQRKPSNPANHVAFKAGNKLKRQRKSGNTWKTDAFPSPKATKRQRKPGNPANHVAFKAGNKLKRQRKSSNTRKTDAFPGPKGAPKHHPPPNPIKRRKTTCV